MSVQVTAKNSIISSPPPQAPATRRRIASARTAPIGGPGASCGNWGGRGHSSSCCGCLGWGAACIFGNIQHSGAPAYWILGERRAPWAAFRRKRAVLEALEVKNGAFGAVLRARTRSRGLRDAEYSGICTVPTGVPADKRRPPCQSIHSAGLFMQNSDCRCTSSSLEPESRNRLLGALEGADHVNLIERSVGGEVDDDCKAEGKHHGKHVAQRLDFDVKVQ